MSQPSILQVKQSQEEEFEFNIEDIEGVFHDPASTPSKNPTVSKDGNVVKEDDDDFISDDMLGQADDEWSSTETSNKSTSKFSSLYFLNNKVVCGITALAMLALTAIIGASVGGYSAAFNRQQMNALAVNAAKAGKVSFCEPEHQVSSCGQIFVNEKVVLSDDLICTESVSGKDPDELKPLNAAIKLQGPDASIDCKGFSVRQASDTFGSDVVSCPWRLRSDTLGMSTRRMRMKRSCDVYYQVGIWLEDGATAVNCKSEQFYEGFFIHDGGEIKKSEAARNFKGVMVRGEPGSTSKISDMYTHHNDDGFLIFEPNRIEHSVTIKDSLSKYNLRNGMLVRDSDVTVKDSIFSHNEVNGIRIAGELASLPTKVTFEGVVSTHHNEVGVNIATGLGSGDNFYSEVNVKGEVNTYLNSEFGLEIENDDAEVAFTVEKRGSLNACQNDDEDIFNVGNVDFVDEGNDGYTYDISLISGSGEPPSQVACPSCT